MRRMAWLLAALCLLAAGLRPGAAGAVDARVTPFLGTFVGTAEVTDETGAVVEQREMDIIIEEGESNGFVITWVNVTLVDGRRDVPGITRRVQRIVLRPGKQDGVYVEDLRGSMFESRRNLDFVAGDPVRWADVRGDRLGVYSLVLLEDGRYELQRYERVLTETGLDITYERIVEGVVTRRITGRAVRVAEVAEPPAQE